MDLDQRHQNNPITVFILESLVKYLRITDKL